MRRPLVVCYGLLVVLSVLLGGGSSLAARLQPRFDRVPITICAARSGITLPTIPPAER